MPQVRWRSRLRCGSDTGGAPLAIAPSGDIYAAGQLIGTASAGDLALVKLNASGAVQWTRTVDGGRCLEGCALALKPHIANRRVHETHKGAEDRQVVRRVGAAIAHQVFGAIGFTKEHVLHRFTLRLLAWRDDFGNESYWAVELGNKIAKGGADEFWPLVAAR